MRDEHTFIDAILTNPEDDDLRLVYADWLEENGDPRSEFLRAEAQLARLPKKDRQAQALRARLNKLRPTIDGAWLALLDRAPIEGCFKFQFQCPRQWEKLKPTDDSFIRHCDACRKKVFYCTSVDHAQRHAARGHCVAIDSHLLRKKGDLRTSPSRDPGVMVLGMPAPPLPRYRLGQRVTVQAGLFQGREGFIKKLSLSELRATVAIDLPDTRASVEVEFEDLLPA
jgi:uncharacterized protein (TIGR02996 family)